VAILRRVLVDLMVPAFGDDALVRQTIVSVREQTDAGWRLRLIDDGPAAGRDGGLGDWVARLGDRRIHYTANPVRLGINRNFQKCADAAESGLVTLLGADDRLLPDFVARVRRAAAEHPELAMLHTGAVVIGPDGDPATPMADRIKALTALRSRGGVREVGGEQLAASLLRGNWMYFPSVVFRREWLVRHGFRRGYDVVQDLDLYLRILRDGGRVGLFAEPGIEYRRHPASVSSEGADDGWRFVEERRFFAEAAAEMTAQGWPRAARAARLHLTSRLHGVFKAPALLAGGQSGAAGRMLRGALATLPAAAELAAARPAERAAERPAERPAERTAERTAERPAERTAEAERVAEPAAGPAAERAAERAPGFAGVPGEGLHEGLPGPVESSANGAPAATTAPDGPGNAADTGPEQGSAACRPDRTPPGAVRSPDSAPNGEARVSGSGPDSLTDVLGMTVPPGARGRMRPSGAVQREGGA
jgi:GT2 family glycosyltransferase